MAEVFYDKRGITHKSADARDFANAQYYKAEQETQERIAKANEAALELQREATMALEDAAREAEQTRKAAEKQARAIEKQVQLERDVLFLSGGNGPQRLQYYLERSGNSEVLPPPILPEIVRTKVSSSVESGTSVGAYLEQLREVDKSTAALKTATKKLKNAQYEVRRYAKQDRKEGLCLGAHVAGFAGGYIGASLLAKLMSWSSEAAIMVVALGTALLVGRHFWWSQLQKDNATRLQVLAQHRAHVSERQAEVKALKSEQKRQTAALRKAATEVMDALQLNAPASYDVMADAVETHFEAFLNRYPGNCRLSEDELRAAVEASAPQLQTLLSQQVSALEIGLSNAKGNAGIREILGTLGLETSH